MCATLREFAAFQKVVPVLLPRHSQPLPLSIGVTIPVKESVVHLWSGRIFVDSWHLVVHGGGAHIRIRTEAEVPALLECKPASSILSIAAVGVKLFLLCRLLTLLGHSGASQVAFKSFTAGRAASLAASGHSIGNILIASEWKSSAPS